MLAVLLVAPGKANVAQVHRVIVRVVVVDGDWQLRVDGGQDAR